MIERSFRMDEALYARVKEIAETEGVPASYLLRLALQRFVDDYDETCVVVDMGSRAAYNAKQG